MNARFLSKVRVGLTVTGLTLCGALALTMATGCAGDSNPSTGGNNNPSTGGNNNPSTGGNSSTGGDTGSSTGGNSSTGGDTGSSTGGSTGSSTGGSTGTAPSGNAVTFKSGQASGAMTGVGWVALGAKDKITDPTCDTAKAEITKAAPCSTVTNWAAADTLCLSGTVPALPATPVQADYDNNWGVQVGVNTSEPTGTTLGQAFTTLTYEFTGTPSTGLRGQVHLKGDPDATTYCANIKSGTAVTLTDFNTKCWGETGTVKLTADKVSSIDKVMVQVSATAKEIAVSSLCLKSLTFGK